jgi:hypothetical protein
VPRRRPDRRVRQGSARPERPAPSVRRSPVRHVDEEALELRETGLPYSTIARRLELRRATDAHRAFIRALRARGGDEQRRLVANEQVRLDALEGRIRARDAAQPEKLEGRLVALANLRAALP